MSKLSFERVNFKKKKEKYKRGNFTRSDDEPPKSDDLTAKPDSVAHFNVGRKALHWNESFVSFPSGKPLEVLWYSVKNVGVRLIMNNSFYCMIKKKGLKINGKRIKN